MIDRDKILKIIRDMRETPHVDFKRDFYASLKNSDFPKDIAAFANLPGETDRYIIIGVEDKTRAVTGIDPATLPSQDTVDGYLHEVIEPFVHVEIGTVPYDDTRTVGYLFIPACNADRPYMIAEGCGKNGRIERGDIYIRKGTCNQKALRMDIDEMYARKRPGIRRLFSRITGK